MPRWHPISISGYHIREAGSTAQQELAFTLPTASPTCRPAIDRGLAVDVFAPRLSFFFNAHIDFFEEIAKYRAARRIWAREMRETFGARDPASWRMRFHSQTAGVSLTAQQPLNNVVRTALEGCPRCSAARRACTRTPSTRRLRCPTEDAVRLALRTSRSSPMRRRHEHHRSARRQLLREALTDRMEEAAYDYFRRIDELGGMVEAVKRNFPQREIADASWRYQEEVDEGRRLVVGVNRYRADRRGAARDPADRPGAGAETDRAPQATRAGRDAGAVEPVPDRR